MFYGIYLILHTLSYWTKLKHLWKIYFWKCYLTYHLMCLAHWLFANMAHYKLISQKYDCFINLIYEHCALKKSTSFIISNNSKTLVKQCSIRICSEFTILQANTHKWVIRYMNVSFQYIYLELTPATAICTHFQFVPFDWYSDRLHRSNLLILCSL